MSSLPSAPLWAAASKLAMQTIDYTVLLLYFAGMIAIGIWAMKRVKDQEDYFMGGRVWEVAPDICGVWCRDWCARAGASGQDGLDKRSQWCLVGVDVAVCYTNLLDHSGLVPTHASPDVGRLVC
jgi:hypothetical protein